jgi:tRNA(adenine34) deaminase
MSSLNRDETFMRLALKEAQAAGEQGEVPVGAVFVQDGKVIARARNQTELLTDPTAHAELVGITTACAALGVQRLTSVEVFVTKEPCAMCAGALVHARIARLVVGTPDPKAGACGSVLQVADHPELNHSIPTFFGALEEECRRLLQEFFRTKR